MNNVRSSYHSVHLMPGLLPWQSYFLAFVLGIFALKFPVPACVSLSVFIFADSVFRGEARRLPVLIFLLCAAFGYGYAVQRTPATAEMPVWMESRQAVVVHGIVDRLEPRAGQHLRLILRDMTCQVNDQDIALSGMLVWNWRSPHYDPLPGQSVEVLMRVVPVRSFGNPGGWDYAWYWQRQGVLWRGWVLGKHVPIWGERPDNRLWSLKSRLRTVVAEHLFSTQGGAMVLALATGDHSLLNTATADAMRAAGLSHTLALSGLHVGFVAAMGLLLAWLAGLAYPPLLLRLPRPKLAVLMAAPLVLGYTWLGQPSESLVRAATMYAFWGFLLLQGRDRVLLDGLFFALAAIILVSPLVAYDLSLQMSAVAVAGIGLMLPLIRPFFSQNGWWRKTLGWIFGTLSISVCTNIALMPIMAWHFGAVSPNILLNVIWLPVLGLAVMPLGLAGMVLSMISWSAPFGVWFLGLAATIMNWLLALLQSVSGAGLTPVFSVLRPLWPEIVGCALLLVVMLVSFAKRRIFVGLAGIGFIFMVAPHIFIMALDTRDVVTLSLVDVGVGQSALISLPGGHRWLVDGGGGSSEFDLGEAVVVPWLTLGRPPRLDGVFMSHPDADHSHGLPFILSRFAVGAFYTNGMIPGGQTGHAMRATLGARGILPITLQKGERVALGNESFLEVVHPPSEVGKYHSNESSLVMRLVRRGKPLVLLPGDVEAAGLNVLLASGQDVSAEVLILPHHGSKASFSEAFYSAVGADVVLCSDGYLNRYGFPHASVVKAVGVPFFTTSGFGLISCDWSSENYLNVQAFLQQPRLAK